MADERQPTLDEKALGIKTSHESGSMLLDSLFAVLRPLASLKLTVVLMAMSIFIVLAGTFAQVDADIWTAINTYFRINTDRAFPSHFPFVDLSELFVRIEYGMFFPASFFPEAPVFPAGLGWLSSVWPQGVPELFRPNADGVAPGFWFPRGWLIGLVMMFNLVAAHTLRFKVQAQGGMLWGGLGALALGILVTTIVVFSGSNPDGVQANPLLEYDKLWKLLQFSLFAMAAPAVYGAVASPSEKSGLRVLLASIAVVLCGLGAGSFWMNQLSDPSMRIVYQLGKGLLAALVLLVGCVMVFKKRAGIVLLHGGIGLLMAYEVLVGTQHVESRMVIFEGESSNYSYDIRSTELAFVDKNAAEGERHVVIDGRALKEQKKISDERLPFDVEVVEWFENSQFADLAPGEEPVATAGIGARAGQKIQRLAPNVGTDSDRVDVPAAYVRLVDRANKQVLGVYALSSGIDLGQKVGSGPYEVALRFVRLYKPYSVYLYDIQQNNYAGTARARDYRAIIKLTDGKGNIVLDQYPIWMNNPLRYAGETYYQSSIKAVREGNRMLDATELQVVLNQGWMAPYVACMIVAVGMLYQFGETLLRFLNRYLRQDRSQESEVGGRRSEDGKRGWAWWVAPAAYTALGLGFVAPFAMLKPKEFKVEHEGKVAEVFRVGEFGELPIIAGGRAMPLDTLARNRLMLISDRQTFKLVDPDPKDDEEPKSLPAIQWLLDMAARPEVADTHPVFRIENDELTKSLGMKVNEGRTYALNDFKGATERLLNLAREADKVPKAQQTVLQRKQFDLFRRLKLYQEVKDWFFDPWRQGILAAVPDLAKPDAPAAMRLRAAELLANQLRETRDEMSSAQFPLIVPTQIDAGDRTIAHIQELGWEMYPVAAGQLGLESLIRADHSPATVQFQKLLEAWKDQKGVDFNQSLADYRRLIDGAPAETLTQGLVAASFEPVGFEAYFNRYAPFNALSWAYLGVFLAVAAAWMLAGFGKPIAAAIANRSGLWLAVALLLIHTWAIAGRIYISGRPPVTNLYSSAIFIGWATVLGGIIFESIFKLGFGNIVAAASGFATLRIAYGLMSDGDTLGVLEPVLDTTFWLATHVVCITLGYAATYVAGLLALNYILRGSKLGLLTLGTLLLPAAGLLAARGDTPSLIGAAAAGTAAVATLGLGGALLSGWGGVEFGDTIRKQLVRMIYGTLCVATILSFVGTVLGGLWADDSWGRFWGWDPKENGALIIVMWNALILHARWDGLVRDKGLAVLAVLGNIVVSWSWFGVNELGVGLHAYGFTEGRLFWLLTICLTQLIVATIGCLPRSLWWGTRPDDTLAAR
jgi:ABC-type transport system involved in cytochrome c biogenesis permease subunit